MGDERKDQNLPAKPTSSLMGQLVRQRQGEGIVPSQQQNTGLAGGQAGTNVGARPGAAPPPGQSGMARPGGAAPQTGVAGARPAGGGGVPATEGPTRSDIERIDAKDEYGGFGHGGGPADAGGGGGDVGGKFSANQQLIREREKFIIEQLRRELDTSRLTNISEDTQAQVRARIREIVNSDPAPLTMMEKGILLQNVLDEVFGFGPLGPLLRDPSVGDICVNSVGSVYVERHGRLEKTSVVFENDRHLRQTIDKIIQPLGRRLDENSPMVDARLPNGSRVNATIPPVTIDGPTITIRCFGTSIMSLGQLCEKGSMSVQMAEVLKACVKGRINMIISGGTGSGKTTLLNALSAHINPRERIITIEDAAELRLQHEHWVRMETRPPNTEGRGQITQRMLVINCLRMRPDRIILGECRGEEAFDMLQAMNTGHSGSMTTIHANNPRDCTKRLENMILMCGMEMPQKAARELIASAIQVIVQIKRLEDGTRRVTEIAEITGMEGDTIAISTMFALEREGRDPRGFFKCRHVGSGLPPKFLEQLEQEAVPFKLEWLR
ncbi:MAG: CpaF family protein [Candidatus Obscuribacter phosphatis]|uniref:CpaF family protein n=1 Tax=Candidatus Obscuribacter phosphatis TaxID=1906157 RepID=A0A8J7P8K1_9BACT|nr:CpaF family protein [Candidatus Obscuribacter phosphatis]